MFSSFDTLSDCSSPLFRRAFTLSFSFLPFPSALCHATTDTATVGQVANAISTLRGKAGGGKDVGPVDDNGDPVSCEPSS